MSSPMPVGTNEWRSRQGSKRRDNRDASGIHVGASQIIAVVVDGTDSGEQGAAYAKHWVGVLLDIARANPAITPGSLTAAMRDAQRNLRHAGYIRETAAYAILVLEPATQQAWSINCGDCRVGGIMAEGEVQWLTPVHTCANPLGEAFGPPHVAMEERHLLTRRLHARRFDEPAVTKLEYAHFPSWIIATDGYWVDYLWLGQELDAVEDDASALFVTCPVKTMESSADCANFERSLACNDAQI